MKTRRITLHSSNVEVKIDPAEWLIVSGAKDFDASSTQILRLFCHRKSGGYLVYAMESRDGNKTAEAYEMVPVVEAVPAALDLIAKHCGVDTLRARVNP